MPSGARYKQFRDSIEPGVSENEGAPKRNGDYKDVALAILDLTQKTAETAPAQRIQLVSPAWSGERVGTFEDRGQAQLARLRMRRSGATAVACSYQ